MQFDLGLVRDFPDHALDTSVTAWQKLKVILGIFIGPAYLQDDTSGYAITHDALPKSKIALDSDGLPHLLD
jgi:hypothetical protein